jgi:predicted kinase
MKKAILTFGLPGAGKSTWIDTYIDEQDPQRWEVVSADQHKELLVSCGTHSYFKAHEESVIWAEKHVKELSEVDKNIIMDTGGINSNYTQRIINNLKEKEYHVEIVFIDTPTAVCIERNHKRKLFGDRYVHTEEIKNKAARIKECITKITPIVEKVSTISYFTNKYLFLDMDGCIAEYQTLEEDSKGNIDFVNSKTFINANPVLPIIQKTQNCYSPDNIFILSASPNSICNQEKREWLQKYTSFIKKENIYFVGNKQYKTVMLQGLLLNRGIKAQDIMVVDDDHFVLSQCQDLGINAIHPSTFINFNK